jgi:hypothetical protein
MTRLKSALLALSMLAAVPAFAQTDVTGDWNITFRSGPRPSDALVGLDGVDVIAVIALKQDGDKVSGTYKSAQGDYDFTGGTLTGKELRFVFTIRTQGMKFRMKLAGKVEGATMTGKAYFGDFAEQDWTAKRSATTTARTTSGVGFVGKWDVVLNMPGGDMPASAILTHENGKVSGTFTSQMGEVPVSGTAEGDALKITMVAQTPQGERTMVMTGDLDGDNIINGKADIAGMGQMPWTAKRAKH